MIILADKNDVDVQDILSPHVIGSYLTPPQTVASERLKKGDRTLGWLGHLTARIYDS